ncbi:MAG: type II toxin-antitoxin system VapC family toxin [Candidatus Omnitrophica bacterium]|nr:type II toxin-antitoxin system VapC family toxin [Candidatus Omnitrophota bacterium]
MAKYLADSDVLIWILRGRQDTAAIFDRLANETGDPLACSALTVLEIWSGVRPSETHRTSQFLDALDVLPTDRPIATLAADLLRTGRRPRTPSEWVDTVIAATALHHRLTLLTYNRKDYPYPDLVLYPF